MQRLFGGFMVLIAGAIGIPIAVVYYGLWVIVVGVVSLFEGIHWLSFLLHPIGWIVGGWFIVVLPLIWTFTTRGEFWRVPGGDAPDE